MRRRHHAAFIAITSVLIALNTNLYADTITQVQTFGKVTPVAIPPVAALTLTINKFDTSLGTLTGVQLLLRTTVNITAAVTTTTAPTAHVTGVMGTATVTISTLNNLSTVATGTVGPFSGDVAGNTLGAVVGTGSTAQMTSSLNLAASDLLLYQGIGTSSFDVSARGTSSATGASDQFGTYYGATAAFEGDITVIYTYTANAIPETSPAALASLGLIPLGLAVYRRIRHSR